MARSVSRSIIKTGTYPGVSIKLEGKTFTVYDNTPPAASTTSTAGSTPELTACDECRQVSSNGKWSLRTHPPGVTKHQIFTTSCKGA
jgi:hypothetical protein